MEGVIISRINSEPAFRLVLSEQSESTRNAFEEIKKRLNKVSEAFLHKLRSTLGAHLDESVIQEAINGLEANQESVVEFGRTVGGTHYRFAAEIMWTAIYMAGPGREGMKVEEFVQATADLMFVIKAIDDVFDCYVDDRRLHSA